MINAFMVYLRGTLCLHNASLAGKQCALPSGTEKSSRCQAREDRDARRTGGTLSVSARNATPQMDFYRSRLFQASFGRLPVDVLEKRLDVVRPLEPVVQHEGVLEDV